MKKLGNEKVKVIYKTSLSLNKILTFLNNCHAYIILKNPLKQPGKYKKASKRRKI